MGYVFWDDERMRVWKSIYNHKDGSSYILVPPINGSWWSYQRYWIVFFRSRRHFVSVYIMLFYGFSIRRLLVKRHFCVAFYSPNSLILASVFVVSVDLQIKTYFFLYDLHVAIKYYEVISKENLPKKMNIWTLLG